MMYLQFLTAWTYLWQITRSDTGRWDNIRRFNSSLSLERRSVEDGRNLLTEVSSSSALSSRARLTILNLCGRLVEVTLFAAEETRKCFFLMACSESG